MMLPNLRGILAGCIGLCISQPFPISAEPTVVNLDCKGQITYDTDGRAQQKPLSVDFILNISEKRAMFTGMWGCLIDMGSGDANSNECADVLPVSVSDQEVSFSRVQSNKKYMTISSFKLSRYSGKMSILTTASAQPAAQATWGIMLISAELSCAQQSKKF